MERSKASKHRCKCFSAESSSFLYGLRREGPSTERIVLERLLNVLSRAAASSSKNPQRLWAKSEKPEWWDKCTSLPWKNPREHPKDKKETLRDKIDILEKELKARGLMTQALQQELELSKNGKKGDLELKSDFEAVIAKASGLHYMVNQVFSKMDKTPVFSDKIAVYIRETKNCLEQCLTRLNELFQRTESREKRKKSLWEKMGVSQSKRIRSSDEDLTFKDSLLTEYNYLQNMIFLDSEDLSDSISPEPFVVSSSPPPQFDTETVVPGQSHVLRRCESEPMPDLDVAGPDNFIYLGESDPLSELTPSVVETIQASAIQAGRRKNVGRRCVSLGLSALGRVVEFPHEEAKVTVDKGKVASRRTTTTTVSHTRPDIEVATIDLPEDLTSRFTLRDEAPTRRHKHRNRWSHRPSSWGGDVLPSLEGAGRLLGGAHRNTSAGSSHIKTSLSLALLPEMPEQPEDAAWSRAQAEPLSVTARTFKAGPHGAENAAELIDDHTVLVLDDVSQTVRSTVRIEAVSPDCSQGLDEDVVEDGEVQDPVVKGHIEIDGVSVEVLEVTPASDFHLMPDLDEPRFHALAANKGVGGGGGGGGERRGVEHLGHELHRTLSLEEIHATITEVLVGAPGAGKRAPSSRCSLGNSRGTGSEEPGASSQESLSTAIAKFGVF